MTCIPGHVDALGTLIVTSDSVVNDFEWGIDENTSASIRTDGTAIVVSGYAGTLDVDHVQATVPPNWTAVCATPELTHVGRYRVKVRADCPATDTQMRLVWHSGEAPFTQNAPVAAHVANTQIEFDLGVVNIVEQEGTHAWSGRIEMRGDTLAAFAIYDIFYIPADRYGRARGSRIIGATGGGLVATDDFDSHPSDPLTGLTAPLGGNWSGDGDASDFNISSDALFRSVVSDADLNTGRYARLGTGVATDTEVRLDVRLDSRQAASDLIRRGIFARYTDTSNWLLATYETESSTDSSWWVRLYKRVAGSVTLLDESLLGVTSNWRTIALAVDETGNAALLEAPRGGALSWINGVGADADLATGGALDDGGYGVYNANASANAQGMTCDNFVVTAPSGVAEPDHAIHPDQSMQLDHRSAQRENADGTRWGDVPIYTGRRLFLPPATRNDNTSRLVFKWDSNDLATEAVGGGGTLTLALDAESRVLLTS